MKIGIARALFFGVLFACFYGVSYQTLLTYRTDYAIHKQNSNRWNLPPLMLKVIAGEFKGLVADLIVLEAGARLGTELIRNPQGGYKYVPKHYDWPAIHQLFTNSMSLDPAFAQTYTLAQGWLPWEPANMVAETQEILKTAAEYRTWDWRPLHDIGFNEYYFRNNPGKAGKIFLEAAKTPNAPPFLAILGARLAHKGGATQDAIIIMKTMLASKDKEEPGYVDIVKRLQALEGVLAIEKAVEKYEESRGRKPASLADLTMEGFLDTLPPNPYNVNYCLDRTGNIFFDRPDCR